MFLTVIALLSVSASAYAGEWDYIPVNDTRLNILQLWLERNIPHLFPEIEKNGFQIVAAKMQVVAGTNFKLTIKSKPIGLLFQIRLYVNLTDYIRLEFIKRPIGSRPILGGYRWQRPQQFSNAKLNNFIRIIQEQSNLLVGQSGSVLMYRTKIVKGLLTHVVFRDSNDKVFSAVVLRNPTTKREELVSVDQIY